MIKLNMISAMICLNETKHWRLLIIMNEVSFTKSIARNKFSQYKIKKKDDENGVKR